MLNESIHLHFDSKDYQLEHKIGQGGFGSVFKATHKKTNQAVAIKFLQLSSQSNEKHKQQLVRFERESNFVCQMSHPHIVRLLDKGSIGDTNVYSVFEFVDGISLSDYIKQEGALSVEQTHSIMLQVLDALVHAHKQGIIHRDIKPSNIMISQTGAKHHVKLLDFGISTLTLEQRAEDYMALTITQETVGTPTYCAPEQLRGELTTFSSDLYMWGLVYLECLTGTPAVTGASAAEVYHKHLNDVPVSIPAPILSHPLGQSLQRCLRKNASERINSAQALYNELSDLILTNLVGRFAPTATTQIHNNDDTLQLRQDDPDYLPVSSNQSIERKQITALALRIRVKSLNQPSDSDTDVIETIFQATRRQYIDVAHRYGGFHVGNLTEFSVFYFGYPVASDHDARLAARTALEIISLSKKQQSYMSTHHDCEFELNIGIHTGIILKRGNTVPDGFASHRATDLALLAQKHSILCSLDTKIMLDNYYQFAEHQTTQQNYAQLISERTIEAFGFIRGVRNTYPLIGRATELDILRSAQKSTADQKVIHLYGEAGIGKSRLIHEFRQQESDRIHHIFQALPEHQNNALFPVLSVIKRLLTSLFDEQQSHGQQLIQLIEKGNLQGPTAEIITLLAAWLNINDIENRRLSNFDPAEQKSLLFEGLAYILTFAQQQNTQKSEKESPADVYIFEDIHWADSTTLEFIDYLTKQGWMQNIISTSRQPAPAIFASNKCKSIQLKPLPPLSTEEFIHVLFDGAAVSNEIMTVLVTRTDGIPLFIEELVSMLKRRNLVHLNQGVITFINPQQINEIPSSLRESIQNKIDALIYAKDTLQLAAVIGREFSYNLLLEASYFSELQIQNDLAELIENQLIIQQRNINGDRYLFKHALVRDAGYDSIEKQSLPERHELIAKSILKITDNIDRFVATDLAQHYEKAQQYDNASEWYYQAASDAETNYAINDAIHLYQKALGAHRQSSTTQQEHLKTILKGLSTCLAQDGQHEKARKELQELIHLLEQMGDYEALATAQIALGRTYEVIHQHGDALQYYEAAHASLLKSQHSSTPEKSNWWKIWLEIKSAILHVYYWLGEAQKMAPILEEMEPVKKIISDKKQLVQHYDDQLHFLVRNQRYVLSSDDLAIPRKALSVAQQCDDQSMVAYAFFMLGFSLILSKDTKAAIKELSAALNLAQVSQDKILEIRCYSYLTIATRQEGDITEARECAEASLRLSREAGMNDYVAVALANLSWSYFAEANYQQAGIYLEQSLVHWNEVTTRFEYPFLWLSHLQAIVLCEVDSDFAQAHSSLISSFATTLLDSRQVLLPQAIEQILLQLSDTINLSQRPSLIEKLAKIAAEHRLL